MVCAITSAYAYQVRATKSLRVPTLATKSFKTGTFNLVKATPEPMNSNTMKTGLILGASVWADGPSPTLLRRAKHGAFLYHNRTVERLIACGGQGKHPPTEAEAIAKILRSEGVPDEAILEECNSTTTGENISFAINIIGKGSIVIITDWYHAPRARLIARRLGCTATSNSPTMAGTSRRSAIKSVIREALAYLVYWLRLKS